MNVICDACARLDGAPASVSPHGALALQARSSLFPGQPASGELEGFGCTACTAELTRFRVPGWSNRWRLNRLGGDADDALGESMTSNTPRADAAGRTRGSDRAALAFALADVAVHAAAAGYTRARPATASSQRIEHVVGAALPAPGSQWALPDGTRFTVIVVAAEGATAAERGIDPPATVIVLCMSERLDDPGAPVFRLSPAEWAGLRQREGLEPLRA